MQIKEIMTTPAISVGAGESVAVAARLLSHENVGMVPVTAEDGRLRGVVTDRDLVVRCLALGRDPETTSVERVMTGTLRTVSPDDEIEQAEQTMCSCQVRRLPVTENGKLVGMVTLGDLARQPKCAMEAADCLCEIVSNVKHAE